MCESLRQIRLTEELFTSSYRSEQHYMPPIQHLHQEQDPIHYNLEVVTFSALWNHPYLRHSANQVAKTNCKWKNNCHYQMLYRLTRAKDGKKILQTPDCHGHNTSLSSNTCRESIINQTFLLSNFKSSNFTELNNDLNQNEITENSQQSCCRKTY